MPSATMPSCPAIHYSPATRSVAVVRSRCPCASRAGDWPSRPPCWCRQPPRQFQVSDWCRPMRRRRRRYRNSQSIRWRLHWCRQRRPSQRHHHRRRSRRCFHRRSRRRRCRRRRRRIAATRVEIHCERSDDRSERSTDGPADEPCNGHRVGAAPALPPVSELRTSQRRRMSWNRDSVGGVSARTRPDRPATGPRCGSVNRSRMEGMWERINFHATNQAGRASASAGRSERAPQHRHATHRAQ